jgi:5-methylthioadenosine/S-adenosylhomocysteine deaminase
VLKIHGNLDLLITHGTVVTVDPSRKVLLDTDVLVEDGRISKLGKNLKTSKMVKTLDARGQLVLPGFIHGHLHACQTLFRNAADGLELLDWLRERIWPFEAAHDAASLRASADLTFAELIRSGATAALDMGTVHYTDAVFESALDCGFRVTSGKAMMDAGQGVPRGLKETTADSLAESLRLVKAWHGKGDGRLRYAFAPRFVLSCTPELLREVSKLARDLGLRIHTHASENPTECDIVRQQTGADNVVYLHSLGMSGPHVTLAHCVWLTTEEHKVLRETGTVVCHCPSSNLKLASGIAKVPELLDDGIVVALGADGAPCNNNLDIFLEMRLASLLQKPRLGPLSMPASRVLEMATIHGARALGLEREVGSIEVGKWADLTVVDLRRLHSTPAGPDVVGQLVHSGQSTDVRHVVIQGRVVMQDRVLTTLDEEDVRVRAAKHASRVIQKAGTA